MAFERESGLALLLTCYYDYDDDEDVDDGYYYHQDHHHHHHQSYCPSGCHHESSFICQHRGCLRPFMSDTTLKCSVFSSCNSDW